MENSEYGRGGAGMKKKLMNNLALKIFSIIIAVVIWFMVSNISDPVKTQPYSVKVTVTNDTYIYDMGKTYQIDDDDRTVMVYVTGKQSVVENRKDIAVEADLTQIVDLDQDPAYVPLTIKSVPGISPENVTIIPRTIPVHIETVESKDFMISVNTKGTPGAGYEIGEVTSNPEKVTIQGPKSTINKIKNVVATIDVPGITTDKQKEAKLSIIDQNGEGLTDDAMEYLKFDIGESRTVTVSVKLWRVKDDVKLEANYSGNPAYGYQVAKVSTTPEYISVAGSEEALKQLEEQNNTIEIPSKLINIDGISQDLEANIKLNALLKEEDGFKVPTDTAQSVLVKVSILPYDSKEFEISTGDIQINGLSDDTRLIFIQDTLPVRVKATDADLETLKAEDIKASVDLTDKEEAEYTLPVTITLPEGYEQVENVSITVQLAKVDKTSE